MIKLTLKQLNYAKVTGALDAFFKANKPFAVRIANRKLPEEIDAILQIFNEEKLALAREIGVENPQTHVFDRGPENKALYDKIAVLEQKEIELTGEPVQVQDMREAGDFPPPGQPWEPSELILGALEPFLLF
jgi:hypothetical protein